MKTRRVRISKNAANHGYDDGFCPTPTVKKRLRKAKNNREWITIHLPRVQPHFSSWKCNTRYVWRVSDKDVLRFCGKLPVAGHIYVCEHQIEMRRA